jgi:uncharacterized protein DUF222/HNH endonuclease
MPQTSRMSGVTAPARTGSASLAGSTSTPAARSCASGRALRSLPKLTAAFATGEVSLDKLRAITKVATASDEDVWLEVARVASGAQLIRICREFERALSPDETEKLEAERGVDFSQRSDGLVTITARLLPEEAEIVSAALEKVQRERPAAEGRSWDQRDADAFVDTFRRELSAQDGSGDAPIVRIVVHVDEAANRCRGRFRLSLAGARELACDGEVQHQVEREGVPIDLGRARRVVSPQLARALRARDGGCLVPGCGRTKVHAHHVVHWAQGGKTNLDNLVSLCSFHHHLLHRGAIRIADGPGGRRFETREGVVIGAPPRVARGRPPRATGSPAALNYTPRLQFRFALGMIADGLHFANQPADGP